MKFNHILLFLFVVISLVLYVQCDNCSKLQINFENENVLNTFRFLIGRDHNDPSSTSAAIFNQNESKVANIQNNNQISSKRFCLQYKNEFDSGVNNKVSVLDNDRKSRINSKLPGPFKWPLVGNALSMGGDLHLQFFKWYKKYGNCYFLKVGQHDTVVLTGYPIIRKAFVEKGDVFENRYRMKSRMVLNGGQDLGMENGERHTILKNIVLSEMTAIRIKKMEDHIIQEGEKLINLLDKYADSGDLVEMNGYLHMFSLNVTLRFLFGIDFQYDKVSQTEGIIKSIREFFIASGNPMVSDLFSFAEPSKNHPFFVCYSKLVKEVDSLVKKYQSDKEKEKENGTYCEDNNTIISKLIKEYENGTITWTGVVETAIDVVVGGSDTGANTIIFCIVSLINDPDIQSKLFANIVSSVPKNETIISHSKYRSSIPYLTMVMKETFRKYPIALLGVPHITSEDVEVNGYKIAAGTQVFQNIYASHRSDEFFNNPDDFIPERFMESSNLFYGSQNQLLQFGCGTRTCVGKNLAETEIFTILATLFKRYEFINPNPSNPLSDKGTFAIAYQPPSTKVFIRRRSII